MKHFNKSNASMGVAATALFIALGGPAQAASLITGANIKNSSITGADIKNKSLTASDFKGSLTGKTGKTGAAGKNGTNGTNGAPGAVGPAGPVGPAGAAGAKGDAGAAGAKGADGAKGDTGTTGGTGPRGATGATGPDGSRWVLIDNNGAIVRASDTGFRVANAYPTNSAGTGNVYIDSGDTDLSDNGIVASIALANQYSQKGSGEPGTVNNGRNPGSDNNPEFSGEITATKCALPGVVACAPLDLITNGGTGLTTDTNRYFVVSPRNSDGSFTGTTGATGIQGPTGPTLTTNTHKRFYVILSGPRTTP